MVFQTIDTHSFLRALRTLPINEIQTNFNLTSRVKNNKLLE